VGRDDHIFELLFQYDLVASAGFGPVHGLVSAAQQGRHGVTLAVAGHPKAERDRYPRYGAFADGLEQAPGQEMGLVQVGLEGPGWIGLTQLNIDTAMDKPLTSARRNRVLLTLWASCFWNRYTL